jgi:hypothetical protein
MCNEVEIVSARMICFREILQKLDFKIKKNILSHISCFFKGKTFEIVFFLGEYLTTFAHSFLFWGSFSPVFYSLGPILYKCIVN